MFHFQRMLKSQMVPVYPSHQRQGQISVIDITVKAFSVSKNLFFHCKILFFDRGSFEFTLLYFCCVSVSDFVSINNRKVCAFSCDVVILLNICWNKVSHGMNRQTNTSKVCNLIVAKNKRDKYKINKKDYIYRNDIQAGKGICLLKNSFY